MILFIDMLDANRSCLLLDNLQSAKDKINIFLVYFHVHLLFNSIVILHNGRMHIGDAIFNYFRKSMFIDDTHGF